MQILLYLTDFIVPLVIFGIVGYGLLMKVPVYDTFIKGAKKGFLTVIKIMPTLVGLMVAVGILRASGFLELIANGIGRFTDRIGFPGELVPLTVVKMFSSSAATGLLLDIFKEYGTARVTKMRYTLTGALLATLAGVTASVVLAGMMT